MATDSQLLANRENSQKSTGPKTESGKAASSRNSIRHGLLSRRAVLNEEDQSAFDRMLAGLHSSWKPANEQESSLVEQIADAQWRLERAQLTETLYTEAKVQDALKHDATIPTEIAMVVVWEKYSKELERLRRYATSFERTMLRAIQAIKGLQVERRRQEKAEERSTYPKIGFVSQKAEAAGHCATPAPTALITKEGPSPIRPEPSTSQG